MAEDIKTPLMYMSVSPHVRLTQSVPNIMRDVAIALAPAFIASVVFFGFRAFLLTVICIIFCLLTEWLIVRFMFKKERTLGDLSALVTAVLLAFNLPPDLPLWMAALGSVFAIGVTKLAFGGLGNNIVNPALAGRVFLLASFPTAMTHFTKPLAGTINGLSNSMDAVSSATPLSAIKLAVTSETFHTIDFQETLGNLFIGNVGGCIGETSVIALLLGAGYLLYKRIIGFAIPLSYMLTVFILFWIFNGISGNPFTLDAIIIPTYHVFAGGLVLGAFFMATDMVTSPISTRGRIVFGISCGVLTYCIRKFGGYPEGVSYSILIMNLFVPLIDRYIRPKIYGKVVKNG